MTHIERVEVDLITLLPKRTRHDAIQTFAAQETPILRLMCADGSEGVGYCYTIGTGGSSIMALLKDHLTPLLIGRDPDRIEAIWRDLVLHTHATHVGAITSLAIAAIDTALWDLRAKRRQLPLWIVAGGAAQPAGKPASPVFRRTAPQSRSGAADGDRLVVVRPRDAKPRQQAVPPARPFRLRGGRHEGKPAAPAGARSGKPALQL